MKMSLCNTFRFFVLATTVVLSIVGNPVPGLGHRQKDSDTRDVNAFDGVDQDLIQEESLTVEVKNEFKRPNDINSQTLNNAKHGENLIPLDSDVTKKSTRNMTNQLPITNDTAIKLNDTKYVADATNVPLEPIAETMLSSLSNFQTDKTISISKEENIYEGSVNNFQPTEAIETGLTQSSDTVTNKNENDITRLINEPVKEIIFSENEKISSLEYENKTLATNVIQNQTDFTRSFNTATDKNEPEVTTISNSSDFTTTEVQLSESEKESNINLSMQIGNKISPSTTVDLVTNNSGSSDNSMEISSPSTSVTSPTGKKYTIIERKRVITTTYEPTIFTDINMGNIKVTLSSTSEEPLTIVDKAEVMIKSETAQNRISLQDTMTSDIPSLEKLKTDLLSYPKFTTNINTDTTTISSITNKNLTTTETTTPITLVSPIDLKSPNTVSSKRAGYLDLSSIVSTEGLIELKLNDTDLLEGPFDAETPDTQDETPDDKMETRSDSNSQLAEDAIKEELLKERTLNDNIENANRYRDEKQQTLTTKLELPGTNTTNTSELNTTSVLDSVSDDNLSVKPINSDKVKNTVLYPVNPNYKPLKKIEVQPAKPFVRDPDDNSWRNESLSSLGIVFKPKNSSKPFTQVLKNKTETEWNNVYEKDRKSDVPDLRERLEQIAQKRKSKKKKIDSNGNVFYTDYEESSSSEENINKPRPEQPISETIFTTDVPITTEITIVTPVQTTSLSSTSEELYSVPALTTTSTTSSTSKTDTTLTTTTPKNTTHRTITPKVEVNKITNPKSTKMFNIFDYYETDDDDIADYLNMAKIDLKKFTVPIQTKFTSPPFPMLYTQPITHYTPERKGTVQYFPPRTRKRPRKNKHDKMNHKPDRITLTESSKTDLPLSFPKLTTIPYDSGMYYTNSADLTRLKDHQLRDEPKDFNTNPYLTTPPLTTLPDEHFAAMGHEAYNRANYVIRQYKDYPQDAEQENDQDKNGQYTGYTQPPSHGITINELIKGTTSKDTKMDDDYDYETQFRKEVLDRFVANFNENTKRFNADFPLLYNNSIVHGAPGYHDKDVALSRAYFRRPYSNQGDYKPLNVPDLPYDPNCDNVTVELSPAYELHYYVPEQEEKQEVESKTSTSPVRYRL